MSAKTVVVGSAAVFLLLALLYVPLAEAAERATRGGYPACETKEALLEAVAALKEDGNADITSIEGCVMTEAGLRVDLMRADLIESKVRITGTDGEKSILWTENNNIKWVSY